MLLDWIPKWLLLFPDHLDILGDLRVMSFEWTITIQDYLNVLLAELFKNDFSDSAEFCAYFLHDPKVNPSILKAVEVCFLKKAGELKVLVNSYANQDANKEAIIELAKNSTQLFIQVSHENVSRAYKVLAIKSFAEICYLPLINTEEELDSLTANIQSLVLNMTKQIGRSERSFCSAFIRTLQPGIIFLLFLDSNILFDQLCKIIFASTSHDDLSEYLNFLMKKDDLAFIDTIEQCLSIFISISDHMRQNFSIIRRIVDNIPFLFLPIFKRSNSSVCDEKLVIFKSLYQNLMMQILRVAHKWLKELQRYPEELKCIVLKHFALMKTHFSFIKSDRNQMVYFICILIKWLLVKDDETRKACISTSILYMGSSLLVKEDLVKFSKTLENIIGSDTNFISSYRSFFVKHGISFMKENNDPASTGKSKEKKILEFFPKVSNNNGTWGNLDSWTELASSALKRKDNTLQGSRHLKKPTHVANQKGISKLAQLKAEIRPSSSNVFSREGRKGIDAKPVQKPGRDKSPVREKRSTIILDITSLNPVSSTVNIVQAPKKATKLHDIDQFYRQILGWNLLDVASNTPAGIEVTYPKDVYNDYQSYFNSFYPLFMTELWGQLSAEWVEQRSKRLIEITTKHVSHIGEFMGMLSLERSESFIDFRKKKRKITRAKRELL